MLYAICIVYLMYYQNIKDPSNFNGQTVDI